MKDLRLQKFNSWNVLDEPPIKTKKVNGRGFRVMWKCQCECGKIKLVRQENLFYGASKSCGGCLTGNKHPSWKGFGEISSNFWHNIVGHAKMRNVEFNITIQYAWNLFLKQDRKCNYSGIYLEMPTPRAKRGKLSKRNRKFTNHNTASLDRIDNDKGYIEGNIQWVHKDINCMKNDMTEESFLNFVSAIFEHRRKQN